MPLVNFLNTRHSLLFLLCLQLFLMSCGRNDGGSSAKRTSFPPKRVLTEAETYKYITPTIYFTPDFSKNSQCSNMSELILVVSKNEQQKVLLCSESAQSCLMQGACYVNYRQKRTLINYYKKQNGQRLFKIVDVSVCPYGLGDSRDGKNQFVTMCLDPFYSVAADFSYHKLGDVIYIPEIEGQILPDGSRHDGYFIVRDSGGGIKGRGRFDFFTGFYSLNATNVFRNIGLGGESNFSYTVVSENDANKVRSKRGFPYLKK